MTTYLILGSTLAYFCFLCWLLYGWYKAKAITGSFNNKVTVIVPVRNESATISTLLDGLVKQSYQHIEIIVVDDHSTDNTLEILLKHKGEGLLQVQQNKGEGKKAAIKTALEIAQGEVIVCTDGDCVVSERWVETMVAPFSNEDIHFVSGPVMYSGKTFFERLQQIELSSLIGTGAATISLAKPTMCNGANIAYRKKSFEAVGGFTNNSKIASGDDEFLMHKVVREYGSKSVVFQKQKQATVFTLANKSIMSFYHQRKRWASKWSHYELSHMKIVAVFVFFCHLIFPLTLISTAMGHVSVELLAFVFLGKLVLEYTFLSRVLTFLGVKNHVFLFLLIEVFYDFYVIFFALISWKRGYRWKGRTTH